MDTWRFVDGFYRDTRLESAGIAHGLTTRVLGNMKNAGIRAAAFKKAGLASAKSCLLQQLHGTIIRETGNLAKEPLEGDGWVSADSSYVSCIYVADCLPIFVWDRKAGAAVGVFHAGWRGLAAGMAREAVAAFERYGLKPDRLAVSVGPHIGACCFKVGLEVAQKFRPEVVLRSTGPGRLSGGRGRPEVSQMGAEQSVRIDLGSEAVHQFLESGIELDHVSVARACTSCRSEEFFSYRRDKMDRRMMAFIRNGD